MRNEVVVEVGEESGVVELNKTFDFGCPLEKMWVVAVKGSWHRHLCVG